MPRSTSWPTPTTAATRWPPARPYTERRAVLVDVLADVGPPLQPVLATADRDTALQWLRDAPAAGG
ncbi:hypothetical protein ABZ771_34535 [Streptomyces globisporus]|uniref:hypothetical protein n=1 Tax=Streptomyces globisporus TaxID=1908 RepID=UPI0034610F9B